MSSLLAADNYIVLEPILAIIARSVARGAGVTEQQLRVLLTASDVEPTSNVLTELFRTADMLGTLRSSGDVDLRQATADGLMLRGWREAPAQLAVQLVFPAQPAPSAGASALHAVPDRLEMAGGPGKVSEANIVVHGGPGRVLVDDGAIEVIPLQFGPGQTTLHVKVISRWTEGLLWSSVRLVAGTDVLEIPVVVQFSRPGSAESQTTALPNSAIVAEKPLVALGNSGVPELIVAEDRLRTFNARAVGKLQEIGFLGIPPYRRTLDEEGSRFAVENKVCMEIRSAQVGDLLARFQFVGYDGWTKRLSPDFRFIALFKERVLKVFEVQSQRCCCTVQLGEDQEYIMQVGFSPSAMLLAAAVSDRRERSQSTMFVLSVPAGESEPLSQISFPGPICGAESLCFSPNERYLAAGSYSSVACVWDLQTRALHRIWSTSDGRPMSRLESHVFAGGWQVRFSNDGQQLMALHTSNSRTDWLWDVSTKASLPVANRVRSTRAQEAESDVVVPSALHAHWASVNSLAFDASGRYLASGSHDGALVVWDWRRRRRVQTFKGGGAPVRCVAFSRDGKLLAAARNGGEVCVCSTHDWLFRNLQAHTRDATAVAFYPGRQVLVTASEDKTVRTWQLPELSLAQTLQHTSFVARVAFRPDGRWFASSTTDRKIKLWKGLNEPSTRTVDALSRIEEIEFAAGYEFLISSGQGGTTVWSIPDLSKLDQTIRLGGGLAVSPASIIAAGQSVYALSASGSMSLVWEAPSSWCSAAFHPSQKVLATGYKNGEIWLWGLVEPAALI